MPPTSASSASSRAGKVPAASKIAGEAMAHSYAHLWTIPTTAFRFFTVYGPWGRPDMALFLFTRKILSGEPIEVYGEGDMSRDFTFVDDLAEAMACGTPCVSTDVGDAAAIVGNTGWIVSPRHPEALADAIAAALDLRGTADWAERKTAARERVANRFSIERMVDNYRSIWFGDEELRADRA